MSAGDRGSGRPRVLHLIQSCGIYGAENVILNLCREMRSHGEYEPLIGCIVENLHERVDLLHAAAALGVEAHSIVVANRKVFWDLPKMAILTRRLKVDLIHCHGYKPAVYAYVTSKLAGVKVMATCHLWFIEDDAPLKMRAMIRIEKFLYRHFPAVVAVSDHIRGILLHAGVEKGKVHRIGNGISLGDFAPREAARAEGIHVLNVARLAQQKGQSYLVAAARLVKERRPDIKISIVGDGPLRSALQRQIETEGVQDTVRLLGFREDVRDLLGQCDIFVLPSLDEGMPISLLEAAATRIPVIVTPVGDIPKLIVHRESGIVVEPQNVDALAQAIVELAGDAKARSELSESAWKKFRDLYSSTEMFARYRAIYNEVLGRTEQSRGIGNASIS